MSEIETHPISHLLGDINIPVKGEESNSRFLPVGAEAVPVKEFNRSDAIMNAIKKQSGRRTPEAFRPQTVQQQIDQIQSGTKPKDEVMHFFILKGNTLKFIGSNDVPASVTSIITRDSSGRYFRGFVGKIFQDLKQKDIENVVCYNDSMTIKDVIKFMEMI